MSEGGEEEGAHTENEFWALASQWEISILKNEKKILKHLSRLKFGSKVKV